MKMKLYRIVPSEGGEVFVVASKTDEAVVIYISHLEEQGQHAYDFAIERYDARVKGDWRPSMENMLALGVSGVATYTPAGEWSVRLP